MNSNNENNTVKKYIGSFLILLTIVTGSMLYLSFFMLTNSSYLDLHSTYFTKDIILFIVAQICLIASVLVWIKVFKEFRANSKQFGLLPGSNGYYIALIIIIEAMIIVLHWTRGVTHF